MKEIPGTETELQAYLERHGVNLSEWERNGSKRVGDLLVELHEGETVDLIPTKERLIRVRDAVCAAVLYQNNGSLLGIREKRVRDGEAEEPRDGRWGISGKIKGGRGKVKRELPNEAVQREILEETGLLRHQYALRYAGAAWKQEESRSYPDLYTVGNVHYFQADLQSEAFKPDGYIEFVSDRIRNHFSWYTVDLRNLPEDLQRIRVG